MPNRVEGFGEVHGGKDSAVGRSRLMESVRDRLGELENLVHCGAAGTKTSLEGRE